MTTPARCAALICAIVLPATAVAVATAQPLASTTPLPHVVASSPQLTADPIVVHPGETLTLRGRGFPPNVHVALLAGPPHGDAARIGGARTGRAGRFTATIHIRPGSTAGRFVARACRGACSVQAEAPFRIAAP